MIKQFYFKQFSRSMPFKCLTSIWLIDRTLLGATTPYQSGPGSFDNEGVLYIPNAPALLKPHHQMVSYHIQDSCCGKSYPSAEMHSVYSTAQGDRVFNHDLTITKMYNLSACWKYCYPFRKLNNIHNYIINSRKVITHNHYFKTKQKKIRKILQRFIVI